jgi:hypothetical protein
MSFVTICRRDFDATLDDPKRREGTLYMRARKSPNSVITQGVG